MAYPYERRPSRPQGNTAGIREENVGDFSGLRVESAMLFFGGPTSLMGFDAGTTARIVNGVLLTTTDTYPATLAQRVTTGSPGGMQYMPVPMTVTLNLVSGVISTDRLAVTVYGENQFGGQIHENFTLVSTVVGNNPVRGSRIFSKVTRVVATARSGIASGTIGVYVGASVAQTAGLAAPRFGLPIQIERQEDVVGLHVAAFAGALAASAEPRTDGSFIVDLAEQSFELTGLVAGAMSDVTHTLIYLLCRSSRGLGRLNPRVRYGALKGGN